MDLLAEAHRTWPDDGHLEAARWLATAAVERSARDVSSWPGGVRGRPSPGLMTGLAGVMQVLARLLQPGQVPGVGLLQLVDAP